VRSLLASGEAIVPCVRTVPNRHRRQYRDASAALNDPRFHSSEKPRGVLIVVIYFSLDRKWGIGV